MNSGYNNGPMFVYLMQRRDEPQVFKIGVSENPYERKGQFFENGKKVYMGHIGHIKYMPIFPDGEVCTSFSEYVKENHYGTGWRYAFYMTRKKVIRIEDYLKRKYTSKCCQGKEWFRLTTEDIHSIKRHFSLRARSDNDFFTKTELTWLSQEIH
jgi:hypothetical protein